MCVYEGCLQTIMCIVCTPSQTNPRLLEFQTKGSLLNHGSHSSCWVQEELGIIEKLEEDGDFGLEKRTREVNSIYPKVKLEEEEADKQVVKGNQQDKCIDAVSLVALLKACTKQGDFHRGRALHADVVRRGLSETNVFVGSTL
eukprot:c17115_g1_i2 orf=415-843(+)